jgi:hypothetical protein
MAGTSSPAIGAFQGSQSGVRGGFPDIGAFQAGAPDGLYPTIRYNVTIGSNTQSSGAGPEQAVWGTGAAHTSGTSQTRIYLSGAQVDLGYVSGDGTHVLWLNTSAGQRHLFQITGFDPFNDEVLVHTTVSIAEGSAVDFAIGGYRTGLQEDVSQPDMEDGQAGWTFALGTGVYYTNTQDLRWETDTTATDDTRPPAILRAQHGLASRPILRAASAGTANLISQFESSSENTSNIDTNGTVMRMVWEDCVFKNRHNGVAQVNIDSSTCLNLFVNCYFGANASSSTTEAVFLNGASTQTAFLNCTFDGSAGSGYTTAAVRHGPAASESTVTFRDCALYRGAGHGLFVDCSAGDYKRLSMTHCTVANFSGNGVFWSGTAVKPTSIVYNNIFASNGDYGVRPTGAPSSGYFEVDYNGYYANTNGQALGVWRGSNEITISSDPFVDSANDDYTLDEQSPGGQQCTGVAFPQKFRSTKDTTP